MLIFLEQKTLTGIVQDGVKDILSAMCGVNRSAKKKAWFADAKAVVKSYQLRMQEEFIPVLIDDFSKEILVKFSGGKVCEEDIMKIQKFIEMMEKSDIKEIERELARNMDEIKTGLVSVEVIAKVEEVRKLDCLLDCLMDYLLDC